MSLINGYVGTYTSPDAPGTYRFTLDADTGVLSAPALVYPQANTKYAAWHGGLLATVTESGGRSGLALLDASDPGCPVLDSVLTEDATACFLTWHEGRIYSANYHDGHVLIYESACGGLRLIRRLEIGAEAGCHQALFHGRWLLVPCLCLDQVRIFDLENGLAPAGTLDFPAGTGPRHGVFNADHTRLYLVSEKSNQLFTYAVDGLSFTPVQADTLLPPDRVVGSEMCIRDRAGRTPPPSASPRMGKRSTSPSGGRTSSPCSAWRTASRSSSSTPPPWAGTPGI